MPASTSIAQASRARRQLARMVGVQHDVNRLAGGFERRDQLRRDARRLGDRDAGVDAHHLDVIDRGETRHHPRDPSRRQHQRIAAGKDHLPDLIVRGDVVERGIELLRRQRLGAGADHLAAEAEAAIDGAGRGQLEQHAVGIAVHDAGSRRVGAVADRVGVLVRLRLKFRSVRHELPRDRIVRIGAVDQLRERRCDRNGVLRGDPLQRGALVAGRGHAGGEQLGQLAQGFRGGVHGDLGCHARERGHPGITG
jgi:hypothetical protein